MQYSTSVLLEGIVTKSMASHQPGLQVLQLEARPAGWPGREHLILSGGSGNDLEEGELVGRDYLHRDWALLA